MRLSASWRVALINEWVSEQVAWLNRAKLSMTRAEAMSAFRQFRSDHRGMLRAAGEIR